MTISVLRGIPESARAQDSTLALDSAVHAMGFQDSVVVESPLPGGIAHVVRFFFSVPQWVQIGGAILAFVLAAWLLVYLWRRRDPITGWVRSQSSAVKLAMGTAGLVLVALVVMTGTVSWDYMQHDNDFCTGCHVMGPAFQAFTASGHADELCHDCHRQSIWASSRQLVMWVAERPENIGSHAEIPDAICQECHSTGASEVWEHIEATAGHRVHAESADSTLADLTCLTCHAPEVHEFVPIDETCAQAGCHEDTEVQLGGMAEQTSLHCATCHEFTVEVAALATTDSAASTLVPNFDRCTGCHEMAEMLEDFEPEREPHEARCGVCHDAHEQTTASDASETCADCHDDWQAEPFHTGDSHEDSGERCTLCHLPHDSKVDASDCAGCHRRLADDLDVPAAMRRRLRAAQPFDTAAALRQTRLPELPRAIGRLASTGDPAADVAMVLAAPADSFEHAEHESLTCIQCHRTSEGHGGLTFEPPRGCQICHHQAPRRADCGDCHEAAADLGVAAVEVHIRPAPETEIVMRPATFVHEAHAESACVDCHEVPVTLAAGETAATCTGCHDEHHAAEIACADCHAGGDLAAMQSHHAPPEQAHEACATCHTPQTIVRLEPDRPFCLACHSEEAEHEPDGQCTTCHLMESPEAFRPRLATDTRVDR